MDLKKINYTYLVSWSEDDNEYVGLCLEFPSLSWLASTPEEALTGIRKVVSEVIKDIEQNKEKFPEPIDCNDFLKNITKTTPHQNHLLQTTTTLNQPHF